MNQKNPAISKGVDWILVWLYIILASIGVLSIFAATYKEGDDVLKSFLSMKTDYSRQALFFIISGVIGTFILLTDSKFFTATANLFYAAGMLLMLLVFPFHSNIKGTESLLNSAALSSCNRQNCVNYLSTLHWPNTCRGLRRISKKPVRN